MARITADSDLIPLRAIARAKSVSPERVIDVARANGITLSRTPTNRVATSFRKAVQLCRAIDAHTKK